MAFAILRIKKLPKQSFGVWFAHVQRSRPTPNADPEREHIPLTRGNGLENAMTRLRDHEVPRKDSPAGLEVMMTMSPEAGQNMNKDELWEWAKKNMDFLDQFFGHGATTHAELHLDESTPHIHALVQPLDKKLRVNINEYVGGDKGRIKLRNLQDQYAEAMREFGLERGIRKSRARHEEVRTWYERLQEGLDLEPPVVQKGLIRSESTDQYRERITPQWQAMAVLAGEAKARRRLIERNVQLEQENEALMTLAEARGLEIKRLSSELEHYKKIANEHAKTISLLTQHERKYDQGLDR